MNEETYMTLDQLADDLEDILKRLEAMLELARAADLDAAAAIHMVALATRHGEIMIRRLLEEVE